MPRKYPAGIRPVPETPGMWRVRLFWKDPATGDQRETNRHVMGTLEEAEAYRRSLAAEVREAADPAPRMRLEQCAAAFVDRHLDVLGSRPNTLINYCGHLDNHILPALGRFYMDAITPQVVEDWLKGQVATGAKFSTINGRLDTLRYVLRHWATTCNMPEPAAARVHALRQKVRPKPPGPNTLRLNELARLTAWLKANDRFWHAYVVLGCMTGMRPGELAALRWEHLDEANEIVLIEGNVQRGELFPTKTGLPRTAPYTTALRWVMRGHRSYLQESQHPGRDSGLVFPALHGGYMGTSVPAHHIRAAAKACGIEYLTPKAMRRTFNDAMRLAGASAIVTRAIAGHTSEAMTEVYSTVLPDEAHEAVKVAFKPRNRARNRSRIRVSRKTAEKRQ